MSIFIKNPEVERKARELAHLTGQSLTHVISEALDRPLAEAHAKQRRRRPTIEEMRAATDAFRRDAGLSGKRHAPITKKEWDAMWPTGVAEIDDA